MKNPPGYHISKAKLENGNKMMISKDHVVDLVRKDSPGVGIYNVETDTYDKYVKKKNNPSYNFSKAKRFLPSPETNGAKRNPPLVNLHEIFSGTKSPNPPITERTDELDPFDTGSSRKRINFIEDIDPYHMAHSDWKTKSTPGGSINRANRFNYRKVD